MRKRNIRSFMAVLLISCLVLTIPGVCALAETQDAVSDNSVFEEDSPENVSGSVSSDGTAVSQNSEGVSEIPEEGAVAPANPVHSHIDETTTWSYVYFGAYPQSEVTDAALTAAIDQAIADGGKKSSGYGIDVLVNGVKYRRIKYKDDCCSSEFFNEVENNGYRYFKWESIRWRVLWNDGDTLFLAADKAMDCKTYNLSNSKTWENCTLRKWLNDNFLTTAFNAKEQEDIVPWTVVNEDNPESGTKGGNDTVDNVYLLSASEISDAGYGFCNVCRSTCIMKTSDYARARGAYRNMHDYKGNCSWWLRSPGEYDNFAADVDVDGRLSYTGCLDYHNQESVVPVLHIKLNSNKWSLTDNGGLGGGYAEVSRVGVSSISISGISKKIAAGRKIKLSADILPAAATDKGITWTSSNPKYATVDADGVVTIKKAGAKKTVTITATAKDGSGVRAEYKIKIMKHAVKKVKITASTKTVKAGKNLKLKATVTTTGKNANKKLKWTRSNNKYATVSSKGVVKATKAGKGKTVTITAMATDGTGKKAKIKIKIK